MGSPDKDQALQFAIMLKAGLPASEAILYFADGETDPREIADMLQVWTRSRAVKAAITQLYGKAWTDMTLEEQMTNARDTHYSQLAYLLFSNHYGEVGPGDQAKLDKARAAIEARLAGTAGKGDALSRFFEDINSGRVKLTLPPPPKLGN